jgi:diadenosine tetraphosphate (Ap4A) HIT family hydrolase
LARLPLKLLMSHLPDCFYCQRDRRLDDLMVEITPLPASTLYLFKEQTYRGRCVVAYRAHVNELFELSESDLHAFMQDVARAAAAIKAAVGAAKINYGAYSDKLPHLHMHLVPKFPEGPSWGAPFEMMPANKQFLSADDTAELIHAIRSKLEG